MPTRHPRALYVLALVQLWERFACFATLPLLVLYLQQRQGMHPDEAVLLFGLLQALSYLAGLPGGYLADRWLGHRLATGLGTILLTLGYAALAFDRPALLGPALSLLAAGHGFFKPGFFALVGGIYDEHDPRRDRGFTFLHVVFNAGTIIAPAVAEWSRARWGWGSVFGVATFAMLASTVSFSGGAGVLRDSKRVARRSGSPISTSELQRERTYACWLVCGVGVVFWIIAVQPTTSLTLFAAQNTKLQLQAVGRPWMLAPGHFMSLHALLVLLLAPPLGWVLSLLRRSGQPPSTPGKMAWGFAASCAAFALMGLAALSGGNEARVGPSWLGGCYVLLTLGELLLAPMGLSLLTRLAPPDRASRMVALWGVATAVGNVLAGALGLLWTRWPHPMYFTLLALFSIGAAVVLMTRLNWLERLLVRSERAQ